MHTLAILLIGYSVFSAIVIGLTHFRDVNYSGLMMARLMGLLLLAVVACLQVLHFAYLQLGFDAIHDASYRMLLFAVAPSFYLFSRPLLHGDVEFRWSQLLHLLPVVVAPVLPLRLALLLAFAAGAVYMLWLARSVYALRLQRSRFRLELVVLGTVFVIAVLVLLLGLSLPLLGETIFYELYASAIGCAFLLVSITLGVTPRLAIEVTEAARETYAVSTLNHVDCNEVLVRLTALMEQDRIYQQAGLDLPTLAAQLGLSSHQLSELINSRLGKSFSRYLREYRIGAAKAMLLSEPTASVLSVGLSVGFTSHSNFYDAFREITGMTPGKFRKLNPLSTPK